MTITKDSKRIEDAYKRTFSHENGEIVLEDLARMILETNPFSNLDCDMTTDCIKRDGARELYIHILTIIEKHKND